MNPRVPFDHTQRARALRSQAGLVVELDGSQHVDCDRDVRRDAFLASEGWTVLRIWNAELDANPDGVFDLIVQRAAECLGGTHPRPLPSREERQRRRRCD